MWICGGFLWEWGGVGRETDQPWDPKHHRGVGWGVLGWDTIRGWDGSPMSPVTHTIRKVGRGWVGDRLVPCIYSPYVFRDMFLETCPS